MLSPETIKAKEFQTTGRGSYRSDDVDSFISEVSASYEQMFRENGELIKKISILANKVEEYRKDEESLKEAILSAQKFADKIVRDAKESVSGKVEEAQAQAQALLEQAQQQAQSVAAQAQAQADETIMNAKREAEEILGTVNRRVTQESLAFDMLQKEASDFRAKLISMYKEHLSLVNELPALAQEKLAQQEAAAPVQPIAQPQAEPSVPAADEPEIPEEPVETAEESPEEEEGFSLAVDAVTEDESEFEDVSSTSQQEEDGFSLALDNLDLDLDEEEDDEPQETPVHNTYASIEDAADSADEAQEDDDDDEPVSFKSFFKKK